MGQGLVGSSATAGCLGTAVVPAGAAVGDAPTTTVRQDLSDVIGAPVGNRRIAVRPAAVRGGRVRPTTGHRRRRFAG